MRAVICEETDGTGEGSHTLKTVHLETKEPAFEQVSVDIYASGVNRADVLQARGLYPAPKGESLTLGLEFAGIVSGLGPGTHRFKPGTRVMGLVGSGGYAESITVHEDLLVEIPENLSLIDAGGIMEAACTVWSNLYDTAQLKPGESVLIHGASGGVGSFAVQLASALGMRVLATARTPERVARCVELGAETGFAYHRDQDGPPFTQDLPNLIKEATGGKGVDVILDVLGAEYLDANLRSLAPSGRLVVIGMQRGASAPIDLGRLLSRRLTVSGTTLRSRPHAEKAAIVDAVRTHVLPLLASGAIRPLTHETFPLEHASEAHALLNSGEVFGKVVLEVRQSS